MNASSPVRRLRYSSRPFDKAERFDRSRSLTGLFDVNYPDQDFGFEASLMQSHALNYYTMEISGAQYERSTRRLSDGENGFLLQLSLSGSMYGDADGRTAICQPGCIAILDFSRPVRHRSTAANVVMISLPRAVIERTLPDIRILHGQILQPHQTGDLGDYLAGLNQRLPGMPWASGAEVAQAAAELLADSLHQTPKTRSDLARAELESVQRQRARRFITLHLGNPELSSEMICAAIGISRSTLYRLFEQEGGVARFLWTERLRIAAERLQHSSAGISTIAYSCGFTSDAHFSRAFRRQFGLSPRQARNEPGFASLAASHGVAI